VLLTAVFTALLSQLSPFLGLIFLIGSGGKNVIINFSHRYVFFILFSGIVVLTAVSGFFPADLVRYIDVLIGVGLGAFIFFNVLFKTSKYESAILVFGGFTITYAYLRSRLFGTFMLQNYDLMAKLNPVLLPGGKGLNAEQLAMFKYIVKVGRNLTDQYNIAIWSIGMIVAVYLGSLLLTKSRAMIWEHKFLKFPHELLYLVIGTMLLVAIPMTKILGFNLLLSIMPLYLIQGTAIMDFFWGVHFARSPILRFLLILVILLNYPILVLLVLVGLFDNWFNFRKIEIREENDENHFIK
jgi:hypothetical protein